MNIVVVAGSPYEMNTLPKADEYIGADRGAMTIIRHRLPLTVAIGDFDSVSAEEWRTIEKSAMHVEEHPIDKVETDVGLAVRCAVARGATTVTIVNATGGRLDHYMSTVHLLYRYTVRYPHIRFAIQDEQNYHYFVMPGSHSILRDERWPYISFFAWEEAVQHITLTHFKYEVTDDTIPLGSTRFTSNEVAEDVAYMKFERGTCLVVRSSDISA